MSDDEKRMGVRERAESQREDTLRAKAEESERREEEARECKRADQRAAAHHASEFFDEKIEPSDLQRVPREGYYAAWEFTVDGFTVEVRRRSGARPKSHDLLMWVGDPEDDDRRRERSPYMETRSTGAGGPWRRLYKLEDLVRPRGQGVNSC